MASRMFNPPHPGEILRDAFDARQLRDEAAAASIGISAPYLRAIYAGEADITAELATKIDQVLGTGHELWRNMQRQRDEWLKDPRAKELLRFAEKRYGS